MILNEQLHSEDFLAGEATPVGDGQYDSVAYLHHTAGNAFLRGPACGPESCLLDQHHPPVLCVPHPVRSSPTPRATEHSGVASVTEDVRCSLA